MSLSTIIPIGLIVLAIIIVLAILASGYVKAPPNAAYLSLNEKMFC